MTTTTLILIIAVVVLAAIVAWLLITMQRRKHLRDRFGPEYHRTVNELGRTKAERDLERREKRVQNLTIHPLSPASRDRFVKAWQQDQTRFVDDPKGAVAEADRLVAEVMRERGYPVADFDQRIDDISVDHPHVVEHYRAARDIAIRDKNGQASTEDLRKALIHYRALFDELLEAQQVR